MEKVCDICNETAKYKCPRCLIYYCSVSCCKEHKKSPKCINKVQKNTNNSETSKKRKTVISENDSYVPPQKLQLLDGDKEVQELLKNKHLMNMLLEIDKAENAKEIMRRAMQEPIFVEFADACLKVVDPET